MTGPWRVMAVLALACALAPAQDEGFEREGGADGRAVKDALEGKTAPALQVGGWLNTENGALELAALRGKVVVLDFWGTW